MSPVDTTFRKLISNLKCVEVNRACDRGQWHVIGANGMKRASAFSAAVLLVVACSAEGRTAEPNAAASAGPVTSQGLLTGVVTDAAGGPLQETLISATGPTGTTLAVCDARGRFEFRGLVPGRYLLRTHLAGFVAHGRQVVNVFSGRATVHSVALHRQQSAELDDIELDNPPLGPTELDNAEFVAAGFAARQSPRLLDLVGVTVVAAQPDDTSSESGASGSPAVSDAPTPHDDSEKAWWLRRARRSVLKTGEHGLVANRLRLGAGGGPFDRFQRPFQRSVDFVAGADLSAGFPLSGQFHLLTRASVDSPSQLLSSDILPGQVAYVALGGPEQSSRWGVQGAVTTGDAGSFVLAGSHVTEVTSRHTLTVGGSYSRQHLRRGGGDSLEALVPRSGATGVDSLDLSRDAASVSADGHWTASSYVAVDYGLNIARYGYLEQDTLQSPHAVFTFTPLRRTRVRVAASQRLLAPGAEEFQPPSRGVWLPPERTFAPLSSTDPLRPERTRYLEVAVERDLGNSTVGVRRFAQDIDEQMITMFGVGAHQVSRPSADHYYLANANGVSVDGWGVVFRHEVAGRVRGSVDYSQIRAEWSPWTVRGLSPGTAGILRAGRERFHDVTTSFEVEIPETATRVLALYRINSAFSIVDRNGGGLTTGLDGRFALSVHQTLPFSPFEGSEWEVLFEVRSLFREQFVGASVYDELFVVSPPKQVVGGLVVNF